MASQLRSAFLDCCAARTQPDAQDRAAQELVRQLRVLQLQLARCHSAHECAKTFPELGPLLATLSRARLVAMDSSICRAVVSTALEYSKAELAGTYANQRASQWFSQLIGTLLGAGGKASGEIYVLPDYVVVADGVLGRQHALQRLAARALEEPSWAVVRREHIWAQAFSACCGPDAAELVAHLVPRLDACGWAQLEQHRLVRDHSIQLLSKLPVESALMLWSRVETVRAQMESGMDRVAAGVLADQGLARLLLDDTARLLLATRSRRVVAMWRRLCRRHGRAVDEASKRGAAALFSPATREPGARLWPQRDYVAAARARHPVEALAAWLALVAAADEGFALARLDGHFGVAAGCGSEQAVGAREAALDVAAFAWAPLRTDASGRAGVLDAWAHGHS
ncbi:hypothetical protein GGF46_002695 [Coemansia sp. RSA 552]|nr:hypothetical protein GGF46_002695 [Coemansia sp. RSA 552]